MRKKIVLSIISLIVSTSIVGFFYFRNEVLFSRGTVMTPQMVAVEKGQNILDIGKTLEEKNIIKNKYYFAYYCWRNGLVRSMMVGNYQISPNLTVPEIAKILSQANLGALQVKITFPEGWTMTQMAERLTANGLPGEEFLEVAKKPSDELVAKHAVLSDKPKNTTLEGYLFPDTYYFAKDANGEKIIETMLGNFETRMTDEIISEIKQQNKTLFTTLTMASIIEGEVPNEADRVIVSGIFWKRLEIGMALQSDATLEYVLGTNAIQHDAKELQFESPYNTYRVKGLPPGPVGNPGISSIKAALKPAKTDYLFFLSDISTGKTIFSKTFEEHVANKGKYGL